MTSLVDAAMHETVFEWNKMIYKPSPQENSDNRNIEVTSQNFYRN